MTHGESSSESHGHPRATGDIDIWIDRSAEKHVNAPNKSVNSLGDSVAPAAYCRTVKRTLKMRKVVPNVLVVLVVGTLPIGGCRQDERRVDDADRVARLESKVDSLETQITELESEREMAAIATRRLEALLRDDRRGLWGADSGAVYFEFKKSVTGSDVASLVALLNEAYPPPSYPGIDLVGVDNSMAHVRVRDPLLFGTGMGTAGAWAYDGAITLTLTSLPQIDSVFIDFGPEYAPGNPDRIVFDHASPGVRSRLTYAGQVKLE